ncbi:hypothetical protein [Plantactinospora sp. CA-290183]|uniref:hypothetical protein n=1 Tax=Plantactinospora sp. CA-290183 TaxID=3240006 RepID=UPI003D8F2810
MAHVELSLSETFVPPATSSLEQGSDSFTAADGRHEVDGLTRWSGTVATAAEPCLLIDEKTIISAVSPICCELLGLGTPAEAVGLPLLESSLRLLDFTAARGELTEQDVEKIPPLLVLHSRRLARGLLRVQRGATDETDITVDAVSTPVLTGQDVVGALTFFAEV